MRSNDRTTTNIDKNHSPSRPSTSASNGSVRNRGTIGNNYSLLLISTNKYLLLSLDFLDWISKSFVWSKIWIIGARKNVGSRRRCVCGGEDVWIWGNSSLWAVSTPTLYYLCVEFRLVRCTMLKHSHVYKLTCNIHI